MSGHTTTTSNVSRELPDMTVLPPQPAAPLPLPQQRMLAQIQASNTHNFSPAMHFSASPAAAALHIPTTSNAEPMLPQQQASQHDVSTSKPPPPPLDAMRAYRACLNCRNRKSKCDLDANQGRPPCRRCQRENRECVLGESHRGGRRVRKKPKLDEDAPTTPDTTIKPDPSAPSVSGYSPLPVEQQTPQSQYHSRSYGWQAPPRTAGSDTTTLSKHTEQANLTSPSNDQSYRHRLESIISVSDPKGRVHEGIASADLQNPSDALEILAQVADRAEDESSPSSDQTPGMPRNIRPAPRTHEPSPPKMDGYWSYEPLEKRFVTAEEIYSLFSSYEQFFHPYFPIIPRETFDRSRLPWLSRNEPHLFSAILTVASKDNEQQHRICYDHMQQLNSNILAGADANVEAVEALLLLSQWVSHRPQVSLTVGRGEEDRVAWMYIGTALRLGYFLGIDRTSFKSDSHEDPALYNRKRLVWAACYVCDRQVSVRVGKGFWARGPGPLSGLKSSDFPTLQPRSPHEDNWAQIFQANLELTQIFSNVHDILYSSKGHGWKEMLEGRYAKYLDDFRTSIRSWYDIWGSYICSSRLKSSLMLTYDYLRLYVNAFAYQATISRSLTYQRDSQHNPNRPLPLINATAPDARFIYEALDAAKSLLSTFNSYVDPDILRCMPSSYYLFIIYSAVFLYKARSTTTMTDDERINVRHMISQTIQRLERASHGANQMGNRYARLLRLLWRKSPAARRDVSVQLQQTNTNNRYDPSSSTQSQPHGQYDYTNTSNYPQIPDPMNPLSNASINPPSNGMSGNGNGTGPGPGFSWLDLSATWTYATQNGNSSAASAGDLTDDGVLGGVGETSPFDMGMLGDYSLLEGDNPNLIF